MKRENKPAAEKLHLTRPKIFKKCPYCGKIFYRQRKVWMRSTNSYKIVWNTQVIYCSDSCRVMFGRKRKMSRIFGDV